jgi:hypothetical protein
MESYHVRLPSEVKKKLITRGQDRRWSAQLRHDLLVLWTLEDLCKEGMSDSPLGRMLEMARNLARGREE